jgi:hypothetical protein
MCRVAHRDLKPFYRRYWSCNANSNLGVQAKRCFVKLLTAKRADLAKEVRNLAQTASVDAVLGGMPSSSGSVVLLFSHRLNQEFLISTTGSDYLKVVEEASDALLTRSTS